VSGLVCLQGGGEFSAACREMDADLVSRAGGRAVVTALAGAPGRDYDTATANGVRHLAALGADVTGAPDARSDPAGAAAALSGARLLVLPGGSPARLLTALTTTPVGDAVRAVLADGGVVMGASAGAMVLCPWTVLPDRGRAIERGLGVVPPLLVVPHWHGSSDWLAAAPADGEVLGIPEESGVLVADGVLTAVGRSATRLVRAGRDLPPGASWSLPQG
jgi:cyanophycinase-like exopeptidase